MSCNIADLRWQHRNIKKTDTFTLWPQMFWNTINVVLYLGYMKNKIKESDRNLCPVSTLSPIPLAPITEKSTVHHHSLDKNRTVWTVQMYWRTVIKSKLVTIRHNQHILEVKQALKVWWLKSVQILQAAHIIHTENTRYITHTPHIKHITNNK